MLLLWRRPRAGVALAVATIVASAAANAAAMRVYAFPPTPLTWSTPPIFNDDFLAYHFTLYIKPSVCARSRANAQRVALTDCSWYRIGPYIIGLLLGYVLASRGEKRGDETREFD